MSRVLLQCIARIVLAIGLSAVVVPLAGCWDREEVNDLALVLATGIDKKDDQIELSVQVFIPKSAGGGQDISSGKKAGGGGGGAETLVRSALGVNLSDAMSQLQMKLPRTIFWGHCDVFIFGEEAAKDGIRQHMDFLSRAPQPRERANVFVSKGSAKQILGLTPTLEHNLAEVLREMAESRQQLRVTAKELMLMLAGDSGAAVLPFIEVLSSESGKDAYINGSAVFTQDKMIGRINDRVTRGLLWLRDDMKLAFVTASAKPAEGSISVKIARTKTTWLPQINEGRWSVIVKIDMQAGVQQNTSTLDLLDPATTVRLEQDIAKQVESRMSTALKIAQKEMNADIFGFAEAFHRKYPELWKKSKTRWDDIFPEINVAFETKVNLTRPGLSTENTNMPIQERK